MNLMTEIDALKKVVEIISPLDEISRQRVLAYAASAFERKPISESALKAELPWVGRRKLETAHDPRASKQASPQEYLRQYNYKVMTKRIGVLGVYLERERQMKRFNFKDITAAFRDAKEPKVPAPSQYARAVIMGHLAKEGDQYYATAQAERLVDEYAEGRQGDSEG